MGTNLDFVIVGAQKAGTTTLVKYLNNHSDIHLPDKELNFFSDSDNYSKGIAWYKNQISTGNTLNKKIIGEKTPRYAIVNISAKRIHECFPNTKVIWCLRNPANRSFSNYRFACQKGRESLSFANAIRREIGNSNLDPFYWYLKRSIYSDQIKNYLEYFPIENMYFLSFEALIQKDQYQNELNKLLTFLGVKQENLDFQWANKTKVKPSAFQKTISLFSKKKSSLTEKLDTETRLLLTDFFKKYNQQLNALTGFNTDIWNINA